MPRSGELAENIDHAALPDQLLEAAGPHSRGQRGARLGSGRCHEQLTLISHGLILNPTLGRQAAREPENRLVFPHIDCANVHLLVLQLGAA